MTKPKEFRNLTQQELLNKYSDLNKQLYELSTQARLGRVERPHRFNEIKKDIARIKTILGERANEQRK